MDKNEGYDSDGGIPRKKDVVYHHKLRISVERGARGSRVFHHTVVPGTTNMNKLEFQDEVSRTLHSLKAIIHYGKVSLADLHEVNSDISCTFPEFPS